VLDFNADDKFEYEFKVSERVYEGFLTTFNDNNPLHTDEAFAAAHGFKGKVMHGNILNGFISFFIGECLPVKNVIIHSQEIQFKNPVYLNDVLRFEASVTDVYESVQAIGFKFTFKNQELKVVSKGKIQIGLLV
jgi:3-hydroxybutyryl-CoA dehydratase